MASMMAAASDTKEGPKGLPNRSIDLVLSLLLGALSLVPRSLGLSGLHLMDDEIFHADMATHPVAFFW